MVEGKQAAMSREVHIYAAVSPRNQRSCVPQSKTIEHDGFNGELAKLHYRRSANGRVGKGPLRTVRKTFDARTSDRHT